jgi:uncharacterized protein YacL
MKINIYATIGGIIGYFVISPIINSFLIKEIPLINRTPLETISNGIIGLSIAIIFGIIIGNIDELIEEKIKHIKMMNKYYKFAEEMNKNGK